MITVVNRALLDPYGNSSFSSAKRHSLLPVIKLDEPKTYELFNGSTYNTAVIRLQELVTDSGNPTALLKKIEEAGGIHNILSADEIILSTIMRDIAIKNLTAAQFHRIIDITKPDHIFTWDGPTYLNRIEQSRITIEGIKQKTLELVDQYPKYQIIGLVKGCTSAQIEEHSRWLASNGIVNQVFHVGDYLGGGRKCAIVAHSHASIARRYADTLMIYGIGSAKLFSMFDYADVFITDNHFIRAFGKQKFNGTRWVRFVEEPSVNYIFENLNGMRRQVDSLSKGSQKRLAGYNGIGEPTFSRPENIAIKVL